MRIGIGLKLSLLAAALVLVGAILIGAIALNGSADVLYTHELIDLGNDSAVLGRNLITPIREMREDTLLLAQAPEVRAVARDRGTTVAPGSVDPQSLPGLQGVLKEFINDNPSYVEATYVRVGDGREVARAYRDRVHPLDQKTAD